MDFKEKDNSGSSLRGFAGMDENKQREIASRGGKAAHVKGTAHRFSTEEARTAGSKGGRSAHQKGTAHEFTKEEAREAGRKGGLARAANALKKKNESLNNQSQSGNQGNGYNSEGFNSGNGFNPSKS